MAAHKYSRQRESIIKYLSASKEHPTADMVYDSIREEYPNISLGTVYRNLALLHEEGRILKIEAPGQPDRFDYNVDPHYHFVCRKCGRVIDLPIDSLGNIDEIAGARFDGKIQGHYCLFYGLCPDCMYRS